LRRGYGAWQEFVWRSTLTILRRESYTRAILARMDFSCGQLVRVSTIDEIAYLVETLERLLAEESNEKPKGARAGSGSRCRRRRDDCGGLEPAGCTLHVICARPVGDRPPLYTALNEA